MIDQRKPIKQMCSDEHLIINPLKGLTPFGWHFEQNVYTPESILRTLKAGEGSGNIPKVIIVEK